MKTKNEIAKQEPAGVLATASEVQAMFGQEKPQKPIGALPPTIQIMRESPLFQMPGQDVPVKEFVGHIIHWHHANQYYSKKYGEGSNEPPDCFSSDGVHPDGGTNPKAGPCRTCTLGGEGKDAWGSANNGTGRGKACKNTIRLYILMENEIIPFFLRCPPSCIAKKDSLMKWLSESSIVSSRAGLGASYQPILVKFTLIKKDFPSGFSASAIQLATVRVLSTSNEDDMKEMRRLGEVTLAFRKVYNEYAAEIMATESADGIDTETEQAPVSDEIAF